MLNDAYHCYTSLTTGSLATHVEASAMNPAPSLGCTIDEEINITPR